MSELIFGIASLIALASGWSLCWQVLFGEFAGDFWGAKKNRDNLAMEFVVSAAVAYALLDSGVSIDIQHCRSSPMNLTFT